MSEEINSVTGLPVVSNNPTGMSAVFKNTINYVLAYEKQPLLRLEKERESLNLRKTAYGEITTKLNTLQSSLRSMISSSGFSVLANSRAATVTPFTTGTTVASVTAGSAAVVGLYDLSVTKLAVAERHVSNAQTSAVDPLGKTGTIWLGGTGTADADISVDPSGVLSSTTTGSVASGFRELGTGTYTIETQNEDGVKSFRVRNADGNLVGIKDSNGSVSTNWMTFTAGASYDTGRGMVFNLSGVTGLDTTVSYTAKGVSVSVETTDSLVNIADKINAATQPDGREITATVVGKQMVFTAAKTGTNHKMILGETYSENIDGLSFSDTGDGTRAADNALFTMNGISFTTQANDGLSTVINGTTLNLSADAAGKQATISIANDTAGASNQLEAFIEAFNETIAYIDEKTALTEDPTTQTYTRGALANETVFSELRSILFEKILSQYSTSGEYSMLNEIGLSIGDDLKLSISDSSKLAAALENNYDDVVSLLDEAMGSLHSSLSNYTGSSGYLESATDTLEDQFMSLSSDIQDFQLHMIERKDQLETQYAKMQAELLSLQYSFQAWQGIYGNTVSFLG